MIEIMLGILEAYSALHAASDALTTVSEIPDMTADDTVRFQDLSVKARELSVELDKALFALTHRHSTAMKEAGII